MIPIVYPYKLGSSSAKNLAVGLQTKQVRQDGTYVYKPDHYVINWGNSKIPKWDREEVVWANPPEAVRVAQNKLLTFQQFSEWGISHPWWTTDAKELDFSSGTYLARTILGGHSGAGILVLSSGSDIVHAPLYVKYVKKMKEYRVHVVNDKVIDFQEKRKANGWQENPNYSSLVRNKHTGWVYCRSDTTLDDRCAEIAKEAIKCLQLDFGAVDIIWNEKTDRYYVLEVNTAPGIEGTTLSSYISAFKGI